MCIRDRNVLDFFTKWGFLTPVDKELDDYGKKQLTVTQDMIDALKQKVNALGGTCLLYTSLMAACRVAGGKL